MLPLSNTFFFAYSSCIPLHLTDCFLPQESLFHEKSQPAEDFQNPPTDFPSHQPPTNRTPKNK